MKRIADLGYRLSIVVVALGFFCFQAPQKKHHQEPKWLNWVDYMHYHPDYRKHQEPQDIATKGCCWGTWVTFPNKIAAIAAKVKNWENPEELFKSLDFVAMYKHPDHYYKHCLAYLVDPKQPTSHKKIVIYAMEKSGHSFARDCYELYKQNQINAELLQLALGDFSLLRIHSLVTQEGLGDLDKKKTIKFLQGVKNDVGADTSIGKHVDNIISGKLAMTWNGKGASPLLHYREELPIVPTIRDAAEEHRQYTTRRQWLGNWKKSGEEDLAKQQGGQRYLMLLEHINCYMSLGDEDYNDRFFAFLMAPGITNLEKKLFLFATYRIGGVGKVKNTPRSINRGVANLLNRVYTYYRAGDLALPLLDYLIHSDIPVSDAESIAYPRYPFFAAFYKSFHIQEGLDRFIALPTIPRDWKDLVKRLKKGTLLSREEMEHLKGYQEFLGTHFILYESVVPRKCV